MNSLNYDHLSLLACDASGHGIGSALANRIYSETPAHLRSGMPSVEMFDEIASLPPLPGLMRINASGILPEPAIPRQWPRRGRDPLLLESRRSRSMILGSFPDAVYVTSGMEVQLQRDDRVLLYTDGITEVFNPREEMLDMQSVQENGRQTSSLPPDRMKEGILGWCCCLAARAAHGRRFSRAGARLLIRMNSMMAEAHMTASHATFLVLLFALAGVPIVEAQQVAAPVKAVQLIGLSGVRQNAKGTLAVENGNLHFVHAKTNTDVSVSSIQDVVTGGDTEKAVGKTIGMLSMAAPYGGGRFLSLFREKVDTLTIQYRDVDGGLHGAIFTMPVGTSEVIKTELVALGAHAGKAAAVSASSRDSAGQKDKLAQSEDQRGSKIKTSAIQVEMIQSDEIKLPAEFQIALYENLIHQIEKQGKFPHIYRDGDHNATTVADLVVLHGTVRGFKAGSERARQVTTVAGATSINVHCQFTNPDGKSLLERDINGKVRFFGGNLKATYDFAKKAARVTHENFSSSK